MSALRRIERGAFALAPSALGFGCASFGSRVGARAGRAALEAAFEAGVNWFDVAPAYGAGEAEALLGDFLVGRRDAVLVTTKVGIAPPRRNGLMKAAYVLGRPLLGAAKGLRAKFRALPATRNLRRPITPEGVTASLEASLRRLRTDHVDIFALHDPDPQTVMEEGVLRALEQAKQAGKARGIAVAGKYEAVRAGAGLPYDLLQMSAADFARDADFFRAGGQRIALHSVFGVAGALAAASAAIGADAGLAARLAAAGYKGAPGVVAADLALDAALAANSQGVVLASMFSQKHRAANLDRAARAPNPAAPALFGAVVGGGEG